VTPDDRLIVTGTDRNAVKVWDLATGQWFRTLEEQTLTVDSMAISPDGRQIHSGSWDTTLKVWDLDSGELLRSLIGHTD
jgi:WD40 repeat protein